MKISLAGHNFSNPKEDFENLGFYFCNNDTVVYLPKGWTIGEKDEKNRYKIFDIFGRARVVYTDSPSAKQHLELLCRYVISYVVEVENKQNPSESFLRIVVNDCDGLRVYVSSAFKADSWEDQSIETSNLITFMNERYPFWKNPKYYWTF